MSRRFFGKFSCFLASSTFCYPFFRLLFLSYLNEQHSPDHGPDESDNNRACE
ncbi:unnamed protein product [Haemonchus placei]|uniref:Secreted protein n=1 Tax=Haemonchus placei TaxID=6290 RepID=A0A0N4X598_HAEPC|nr:unnamed protein product [Haemonchus placei]